jgi:hypothetical protein
MMNTIIEKYIQTLQQGYIHDPNRILQDYHKEIKEIEGYRGRELLELLQNAVDELDDADEKCVCIELTGKTLTVSNNGNVFSEAGVVSLMYSDLSPKYNDSNYIGNKGTGFRSILNWAESVCIFSGTLSIGFNPEYADEQLYILLNNQNVLQYRNAHPELKMATLVAPKIIDTIENSSFDTAIRIELIDSEKILASVKQQLSQIDVKLLLFLKKLEHLIIVDESGKTEFIKTIISETDGITVVEVQKVVDGEVVFRDEWHLAHENGQIDEQHYGITIAYKHDMSVEPDVLYSFFRTDVTFPIPALVHGTFDLSADRNHLLKNKANEQVLYQVSKLLVSVAKTLTDGEVNYAPLRLLATRRNFPNELTWVNFDFSELYYDAVAESKIFPTVNGEYISFYDRPRFFRHNLADYLDGDMFKELLLYTEDSAVFNFVSKIAAIKKSNLKYDYSDIVKRINTALPSMSLRSRAFCCVSFLSEYVQKIENNFPCFVLDMDGKPINDSQTVFLQPEAKDNNFTEPPSFANIRYLNAGLRKELEDALQSRTASELASKLQKLNVRIYNLTTIIQSVISKLNNREHKGSNKTKRLCIETAKWLWKNRKTVFELNLSKIGIPLISRDGILRDASNLYWGADYGNCVTEDLFANKKDLFVAGPTIYGIGDEDVAEFIVFFSALGIAKYPRYLHGQEVKASPEYISALTANFDYPLKAEDNYYPSEADMEKSGVRVLSNVRVTLIDHYEYILDNASSKAIITWLKADRDAFTLVSAEHETGTNCAYLIQGYQQNRRTITAIQVLSYMRYEFLNHEWIEVSGDRYAPLQCLLLSKVGDKLLPYVIAPNLEDYVENINKKTTEMAETKDLLIKIGLADDFSKLSISQFYSVLLRLPEIDLSGELGKVLYLSITLAQGFEGDYENNMMFREHMENGKVFCKNSKSFLPIREVYYLSEKTVSSEVLHGFNIIAIPSRRSMQTIEKYLGVKPLRLKVKIEGVPTYHALDHDFGADFSSFKTFALCYRMKNAKQGEVSLLKSLKVRLCSKIAANYGNGTVELGNYAYIKGENGEVYLKAPNNIKEISALKSDLDFCAVAAEIITSTSDIQDGELYGYEESNRRKVLIQDFDSLDILTEARETLNFMQSRKELFLI